MCNSLGTRARLYTNLPRPFPFLGDPYRRSLTIFMSFLRRDDFNVDPRGFMTAESVFVFFSTITLLGIYICYYTYTSLCTIAPRTHGAI